MKIYGFCRICGIHSQLTTDHIPPKSCGNNMPVEIYLDGKKTILQKGLSAKTICGKCNNELLGTIYDKELSRIYKEFLPIYNSKLYLTARFYKINVNIIFLLKSLLGHILATNFKNKNKLNDIINKPLENEGIFDEYRNYFLGKANSLENFDVYYWYYPYQSIKIVPFFGFFPDYFGRGNFPIVGTLIKFFPFAIFFLYKPSSKSKFTFKTLSSNENISTIKIDIKMNIHEDWPEMPDTNGIVFLNSDSYIRATKKEKNK